MSELVPASELMAKRVGSVNPANHQEEVFDLYSIPAYDSGTPETLEGSEIGSTKKNVEQNDVLISRIVPHIRRCWVVPEETGRHQIASGEWITFRSKRFFPNYLRHYLMSDGFHKQFMQTVSGVGGSLLRARPAEVERINIPLPPMKEQKRIAAILDKADAIRRKRQQAIQLADEFLRSVFLGMFGDPATNPKRFEVRKLHEFYINEREGTKCGPFGSALKKHEYTQSGIPVWNMDNISLDGKFVAKVNLWVDQEKYDDLLPYSAKNGDVLISRAGTVGKMCVLESSYEKSLISTNLIRVRFNTDLLPVYFVSLMNYCKGRVGRLKTGPDGSFTHMNTGILDKLTFPYPPPKLQEQYKTVVERTNNMLSKYEISGSQHNELFASLSQRTFRGDL